MKRMPSGNSNRMSEGDEFLDIVEVLKVQRLGVRGDLIVSHPGLRLDAANHVDSFVEHREAEL